MPGQGRETPTPQQAPAPAPAPSVQAPAVTQPRGNAAAAANLQGQAPAGGGGEAVQIIANEIGGPGDARQMLGQAPAGDRPVVEQATREALGEEDAAAVLADAPAPTVAAPPAVQPAPPAETQGGPGQEGAQGEGQEQGGPGQEEGEGGKGGEQPGGGQQGGDGGLMTGPLPTAPASEVGGLGSSDLALIHEELIEHQRWSGARTQVGEPGSTERAAFIAERAGEGAIQGGLTGLGLGFAAGAIGKLAARFVPIPGVGAILGGAMSVYGLATRDWGQTADTIGKFGEGDSTYEVLANTLASVSEVIQLVCDIMNVIAGIIGVISAVMWIITIITVGVASPLAATLSAIALGIGAASGVLDLINNLVLQPAVLLFRALHAFKSEADPREVEAQGAGISDASGRAAGALGGWVGGKAGEAAGSKAGDAYLQSRHGSGTAETGPQATPRTEVPEVAPTRAADGPAPVQGADAPTPVQGADAPAPRTEAPDVVRQGAADAPTTQGADAPTQGADGPSAQQRQKGLAAVRERFRTHIEAEARITQQRNQAIEDARSQARQQKAQELETSRQQQHEQIDADFQRRLQQPEVIQDRHRYQMEVNDSAHQHRMADIEAASQQFKSSSDQASLEFQQRQQSIEQSRNAQLQDVDTKRVRQELWLMENRDSMSPDVARQMKQDFNTEHSQARLEIVQQHAAQSRAASAEYDAAFKQATDASNHAMQQAETRYNDSRRSAMDQYDAQQRAPFDARRADVDADISRQADLAGEQGAANATPGADRTMNQQMGEQNKGFWTLREHWEMMKAAPEALMNPQSRAAAGQDLSDAMVRSRLDYANGQEQWRPDSWKKTLGRSPLLDTLLYPFAEDLYGPFIIAGRTRAGPQGNAARANERLGNIGVQAGQKTYDLATDKAGRDDKAKKEAATVSSGLYTSDNPGMKEKDQLGAALTPGGPALANTERVNPNYEEPPGTPEQLDLILNQIEEALAARAQAEAAEQQMSAQGQAHEQNQAPIQECVQETQTAMSAQQAHEQAVARRQSANAEQQARQQEAQGMLEGYPERAAGLAVIKGPLAAFQGFTWIASKLPGSAGRAMQSMNNDANQMSEAFAQMDSTMATEAAKGPDAQAQLQGDAQVLTATQEQAATSGTNLDTAQQGAQGLQQANQTAISDTATAEEEARSQKEQLDSAAETKRAEHQSLTAELTGWAQRHREARMVALAQQQQNAGAQARPAPSPAAAPAGGR